MSSKKGNVSYDHDGYVRVYIDGACINNGHYGASAGIGVWFNNHNPLNLSAGVKGYPTNNNAEIQAATQAILQAHSANIRKLRIYTDSQFLINCVNEWMPVWKDNNWINARNQPVKNKISLMQLDDALTLLDYIDWEYVEAHTGIYGNERADALAKQGAQM